MSGLEALGLACNILQLVSIGGKTLLLCRQIHENGKPDLGLEGFSENLADVSNSLKQNLSKRHGAPSPDDLALHETAEKCVKLANALTTEIKSLSVPAGKKSMRASIRTGLKALWKKDHLERLEKDLKTIQSNMNTQLLVKTLDRMEISTKEHQAALETSRRLLQGNLQQYSTGHTDLSNLIIKESQEQQKELLDAIGKAQKRMEASLTMQLSRHHLSIDEHLATATKQAQQQQTDFREWKDENAQEAAYQRLLQSLRYESMNERMNNIAETFPSTYSWIFGPDTQDDQTSDILNLDSDSEPDSFGSFLEIDSGPEEARWDSFSGWLGSSQPVYWISGKPGSGKSTLMKFLAFSPKTLAGLNEWRPNVQVYSHYFWNSGTPMQHNLKGIVCSFLYQLFVKNQFVALTSLRTIPDLCHKLSTSDWDLAQLKSLLLSHVHGLTEPICFFVDGLDEYTPQADVHNLFSLFKDLQNPHVKFCLSSRPEASLRQYLEHYPTLRMQYLTRNDMIKYSRGTLKRALLPANEYPHAESLISRIVMRADGVFLWVVLVLRSIIRGIRNKYSHDQLIQRLALMPTDLMGLYTAMWERSNEDDDLCNNESSWYFNAVILGTDEREEPMFQAQCLGDKEITIFTLMAATELPFLNRYLNQSSSPSAREVEILCLRAAELVEIRSAGLLEVHGMKELKDSSSSYGPRDFDENITVGFVHRTARDFLVDTDHGRRLWQNDSITAADVYVRVAKACILRAQLRGVRNGPPLDRLFELTVRTQEAGSAQERELLECVRAAYLRQAFPLTRSGPISEANYFTLASGFGFASFVLDWWNRLQQEDAPKALAAMPQILMRCSSDTNHFSRSNGSWFIKVWSGRHQVARHLVTQHLNPGPEHIPRGRRSHHSRLTRPWLDFLSSTVRHLGRIRSLDEYWGGRLSDDLLETLRAFLRSGAPLHEYMTQCLVFRDTTFVLQDPISCNREYEECVTYIINVPWLITAILSSLRPDASNVGHEQTHSFARAVEITYRKAEVPGRRTIERIEDSERLLLPLNQYHTDLHRLGADSQRSQTLRVQMVRRMHSEVQELAGRLEATPGQQCRERPERVDGIEETGTRSDDSGRDKVLPQTRALLEEIIKERAAETDRSEVLDVDETRTEEMGSIG